MRAANLFALQPEATRGHLSGFVAWQQAALEDTGMLRAIHPCDKTQEAIWRLYLGEAIVLLARKCCPEIPEDKVREVLGQWTDLIGKHREPRQANRTQEQVVLALRASFVRFPCIIV